MKQIVILGGGYAGINTALQANKLLLENEAQITLIDSRPYHLAYTYLYEVASIPKGSANLPDLKESVTIPIASIIKNTQINFIQATVENINNTTQQIYLEDKQVIPFDYLVVALGSETNFYNIPGAEQYAKTLKSVQDSLEIRSQIQLLVDSNCKALTKPLIRIVVAGGGFAGVELAAELKGMLNRLVDQTGYPPEKLEVRVIEGANQLMPGLGEKVGKTVYKRLQALNTEIQLDSFITEVSDKLITLKNGEQIQYDCLIWTAGVKGKTIPFTTPLETDHSGRIIVNPKLQLNNHNNIFIAGDVAAVKSADGTTTPATARHAIAQGKYIGQTLANIIQNQPQLPFISKTLGYIVPLGGKWAVFKSPKIFFSGFFPYVARQLAMFHYFYTILGLTKSVKLSFLENKIYRKND